MTERMFAWTPDGSTHTSSQCAGLQNLPFRGSRLDDGRICMQDMLNLPPSRDGT